MGGEGEGFNDTVRWQTSQACGIMSRRQNVVEEKNRFKYALR